MIPLAFLLGALAILGLMVWLAEDVPTWCLALTAIALFVCAFYQLPKWPTGSQ